MAMFRIFALTVLLAAASVFASPEARAGDAQIDAAIEQGVVGERIDGYLGIVGDADASLRRKVQEINAKRRAAYDNIAARTGTTTAQVARVTGEKQLENARPGEFIMDATGRWTKK